MLILARHAATALNEQGVVQGRQDVPLSELGRKQASALGTWVEANFRPTFIYSSPARRSIETAKLVVKELSAETAIETSALLRERDYGPYEGMNDAQLIMARLAAGAPADDRRQNWSGVHSVEPDEAIWRRFKSFDHRARLLSCASNGDVFLVSHAGFLKSVVCCALGIATSRPHPIALLPASALAFTVVGERLQLWALWQNRIA